MTTRPAEHHVDREQQPLERGRLVGPESDEAEGVVHVEADHPRPGDGQQEQRQGRERQLHEGAGQGEADQDHRRHDGEPHQQRDQVVGDEDPVGVERAHQPRRHLAEPDLGRQRLHHPAHRELSDDEDEQEIGSEIRGRVAADRAVRGQPHPDEHHDQRQRARDHPDQHLRAILDEGRERDRQQHARQAQAAGEQGPHFAASARGAWRARNTWPMISSIGTSSMPMSAIGRSLSRRAAVSVTRSRATRSSARNSEHSRSSP